MDLKGYVVADNDYKSLVEECQRIERNNTVAREEEVVADADQRAQLAAHVLQADGHVGRVIVRIPRVADVEQLEAGAFVTEHRMGAGHVRTDGDRPDGQLIPGQQISGKAHEHGQH